MAHPSLKKPSKRLTCSRKYKIAKKVREHNRRVRKEAKKHPKGKRDNLVVAPNLCPFKEQAIEELLKSKEQEKQNKLENAQLKLEQTSLESFVENAANRDKEFICDDSQNDLSDLRVLQKKESASLAKEFKKVIAVADIILEVVDARDPMGTRCKIVQETMQKFPNKKLVIVVNKSDLVPRDILEKWLTYLRQSHPAVPFKASTQQQNRKLGRRVMTKKSKKNKHLEKLMSVSSCVGAEFLMKLLANYRRNKGITTSITVGVVGMPNVGKSSLINSLKRARSCRVGAEPGMTRTMQSVQIGKNIKILDSPGIVTESPIVLNKCSLALKNVLRLDHLQDPILVAETLLKRTTKKQMMDLYYIGEYNSSQEFLYQMARRLGLLGRKGVPDLTKAARTLVSDWNRGKIRYYTLPPESAETHISSAIVNEAVKEFDLEDFKSIENNLLEHFDDLNSKRKILYVDATATEKGSIEDKEMDGIVIDTSVKAKKSGKLRWRKKKSNETNENSPRLIKRKKLLQLDAKKKRKVESRLKAKQTKRSENNRMECMDTS